jgi:hypothetical protein
MITDDFDRADTTQTAYTVNVGGTGWTQEDDGGPTGDDWFIKDNALRLRNRASEAILYNTGLETQNGADTGFTLKADVMELQTGTYAGIVFNYTDADNYYLIRFRAGYSTYQLLQKTSSGWDVLLNTTLASGTFAENTNYTVTVTSDAAGVFDFTIDETGVGTVVSSTRVDDSASALTGGYSGLYGNSISTTHLVNFDNFSLQTFEYTEILFDNFNRTNTTQTAYTVNVGGTGWAQADDGVSGAGDDWFINSDALRLRNRSGIGILYNTGLETRSGGGTNFILKADAMGLAASTYAGVVFNYVDEDNYYVFRFKAGFSTYQLLQKTSSGQDVLINTDLSSGTFAEDAYYTVTVASTNAGVFDLTIEETGVGTVVVSTNVDDSASAFIGGYAGLYGSYGGTATHIGKFDNFRLTHISPVPTFIGPVSLVLDGSTVVMEWQGDAGGTYALQSRASLVTGQWSNVVENISGMDGAMSATNDTSAARAFFRVVIE